MFSNEINEIFGKYIKNNIFKCDIETFRKGLTKIIKVHQKKNKESKKNTDNEKNTKTNTKKINKKNSPPEQSKKKFINLNKIIE